MKLSMAERVELAYNLASRNGRNANEKIYRSGEKDNKFCP
jgi:hypothetical protein